MTELERKQFWDKLCASTTLDDSKEIEKHIKVPRHLYRYRAVSTASLSALAENQLYFSASNYYDDPFDTYLHVDVPKILEIIRMLADGDSKLNFAYDEVKRLFGWEPNSLKGIPVDDMQHHLQGFIGNIRNMMRARTWSICFSETSTNRNLWMKYAGNYKGFAVEYDMMDPTKILCGQYNNCGKCVWDKMPIPFYPMYYSTEKYDATNYAFYIAMCILLEETKTAEAQKSLRELTSMALLWESERMTLIKEKCHEYDEEWRAILPLHFDKTGTGLKENPHKKWMPSGVIFGLNMEPSERTLVRKVAESAGVIKFKKLLINMNGDLVAEDV